MKTCLFILSLLMATTALAQVDHIELLTKNLEASPVKTITKYRQSPKFPEGEKKFKLSFNEAGQMIHLEEYRYPAGPASEMVMQSTMRYNSDGQKVAVYMQSPAAKGGDAMDTLLYDETGKLIQKQRIANGTVVRTWDYTNGKKKKKGEESIDAQGNLVKLTRSDDDFTTYTYDAQGNRIEELRTKDGKKHSKETYRYNKKGHLLSIETYLLYTGKDQDPLKYYFEYEGWK